MDFHHFSSQTPHVHHGTIELQRDTISKLRDKLTAATEWTPVFDDSKFSDGQVVAIYPDYQGHNFASYNAYHHCWNIDGSDLFCEFDAVKYVKLIDLTPPED